MLSINEVSGTCGKYVAQQGGCVTCYLHKLGVTDFCPWHQEDDPEYYRSNHQILHLVGKIQPGEINVMGYIDEFPKHSESLFFLYVSVFLLEISLFVSIFPLLSIVHYSHMFDAASLFFNIQCNHRRLPREHKQQTNKQTRKYTAVLYHISG